MSKFHFISFIFLITLSSCSSYTIPTATIDYNETLLDTLTVSAPRKTSKTYELKKYNEEAEKSFDLKHMDLKIEPSWENETVVGEATLTISPYFYPIKTIQLDAVKMDFHSIKIGNTALTFDYDGEKLSIDLGKTFTKDETFKIIINYTARPTLGHIPNERYRSNDQGLYFIEPDIDYPTKPYQIWTQGETEYNSSWFPTRDKPNERYTHSIFITVNDSLKTLSNGLLIDSKKLANNKRQDHWKMDKEHAPYLTMIAIGDYSITNDQWKNIPLEYYVYPEYEAYAQNIFNHTPEMLSYFSEITGLSYPWQKYAQIVVEDFVAGAMENTTAVTFGDFVQKTDEQLIDNHNDDIVAHEMFHHWFGDYVTCESWANLTLNEGFANYSEYLWTAHKYGEEAAHNKRMAEWSQYILQSRSRGVHPLIDYGYSNKELMFDAHSYNKGGLTLHYLRHIIGDEAFFAGMNQYLVDNANSSVEIDDLRLAYEKTTGIDLNPFFDQWFLAPGHPDFEIYYSYDYSDSLQIKVEQIQNPQKSKPIFAMPLEWNIHLKNGKVLEKRFYTKERSSTFYILGLNPKDIEWINFDPHHVFIGEYLENRDSTQYMIEYIQGDQYDKREALDLLRNFMVPTDFYKDILKSETNYINKLIALYRLNFKEEDKVLLNDLLKKSDHISLSSEILNILSKNPDLVDNKVLNGFLENQKSMKVIISAMKILYEYSKDDFNTFFKIHSKNHILSFSTEMINLFNTNADTDYYEFIWDEALFLNKKEFQYAIYDNMDFLKSNDSKIQDDIFGYMTPFLKSSKVEQWRKEIVIERFRRIRRNMEETDQINLNKLVEKYNLNEIL